MCGLGYATTYANGGGQGMWSGVSRIYNVYVIKAEINNDFAPIGEAVTLTCTIPTTAQPDTIKWYQGTDAKVLYQNKPTFDGSIQSMTSEYVIASVASGAYGNYKAVSFFNDYTVEVTSSFGLLGELKIITPPANALGVTTKPLIFSCAVSRPKLYTGTH